MRVHRSMFVGLFALVIAVGILGANGYFAYLAKPNQEHTDTMSARANQNTPRWPVVDESSAPHNQPEVPDVWYPPLEEDPLGLVDRKLAAGEPSTPARQFFPEHVEAIEMAQADGTHWKPTATGKRLAQAEPAPLPVPAEATPLAQPPRNAWLGDLIQQELPHASPEERRVWMEELQGLNPEMVRDILRLRKNVIANPPAPRIGSPPEPDHSRGLVPPPMEDLPIDAPAVAMRLEPSLGAVEQARDVILNNLANLHTVGFKRSRIVLEPLPYHPIRETQPPEETEAAAPRVTVGFGVTLAGTPIDASQGPLKKTDQPLDVALEGPGFFQIQAGGETVYSRCGSWQLNPEGALCLSSGDQLRPIVPRLVVPAELMSLVIDEEGRITAFLAGEDGESIPEEIGQIQLARFRNPSALTPRGGHLFAAGQAAGPPILGPPQDRGFGILRQGMLELSNVSRDEELEEFQTLQTHLQLLKQLAGSQAEHLPSGPVARQKPGRTRRASAQTLRIARPSLEPLRALRDQGSSLIDEYLHSERVQAIKRRLGLD